MTINDRVLKLINQLSTSRADFAKRTGISPVKISHLASGRNKVSLDIVQKIIKAYPQLNAEYLINGKGGVFRDQENQQILQSLELLDQLELQLKQSHKGEMQQIRSLRDQIAALSKAN